MSINKSVQQGIKQTLFILPMKHIFITAFTLLLCLFALQKIAAQPVPEWDRTYGGSGWEELQTTVVTEEGGFLFGGYTGSELGGDVTEPTRDAPNLAGRVPNGDMWLVKTDSLGRKIWDHRYGGDSLDRCWRVIQNTEGYLVVGESWSNQSGDKTAPKRGKSDFWVLQIRPSGAVVWDKTFGGIGRDEAYTAIGTQDGGYLLVGHSDSPVGGDKTDVPKGGLDLWVIKIDRNGNKIWDKTYGGSGNDDYPRGICKTRDGNFLIVCGSTSSNSIDKTDSLRYDESVSIFNRKDIWLLKIAPDGNKIWDKTFGGANEDVGYDVTETRDNGILVAANTRSQVGFDKTAKFYGDRDYWILKLDKDGKKIWDNSFGGTGSDDLRTAQQNATGYILVAGVSSSVASGNKTDTLRGANDFWLCYLDEQGNKIWDKSIGGASIDAPFATIPLPDRGYLICGHSSSDISGEKTENSRGLNDMWVVKIRCVFELNLGNDTAICKQQNFLLDATIPNCPNCLYQWSTGENTPKVVVTPSVTTRYRVRVTATDACEIADDIDIEIVTSPDSAAYSITSPRCYNGKDGVIALEYARGGTPPYSLAVGLDTFKRQIFIPNQASGNRQVWLIDRRGCKLPTTVYVPNPDQFQLTMSPDQEVIIGDSFHLFARVNHKLDTFFWSEPWIRNLDTFAFPKESKVYGITVIDSLGCKASGATQVTVRKNTDYYAPNIFSPNNDGVNDFFLLYGGKFVKTINNLRIFSRWGDQVFESTQVFPARDDAGWDGRFAGKEMPNGVYVYTAQLRFLDGHVEHIEGDLVLMR